MVPVKQRGILLSKVAIYASLAGGFAIILLVGLLCGLVARPNNCIKQTTIAQSSTTTSTTTTTRPTTTTTTTTTTTSTTTSTTTTTKASSATTSPTTTTTTRASTSTLTQSTATRSLPSSITASTNAPITTGQPVDNIRLPDYLIPTNYNLELKVFFDPIGDDTTNDRFDGRVIIDLNLTKQSNRIVLHIDNSLKVNNQIEIENLQNGQNILVSNDKYNYLQNQLFEINLDNQLPIGSYRLKIDYSGNYGPITNIIGFYKTRYNEDGVTKNLVATKFQPTDARRAFPCFDEPALKATYEITIEHPMGTFALSNWPEQPRETISGNRYRTRFDKTYPMSSYLAAWTVLPDDFGRLETTTANGKKIRVFARREAVNRGLINFALEITKESLDFFENEYFEPSLRAVPPKIDSIGFPDFPSGAMEHWGIIGYRETSLLYADDRNTLSNKQSVAYTVSHEVSHFWFGDLVTCKWWNDLWLNEAMARFLQFKAVQKIFPEWDVQDQFLTSYLIPVMYDDGFMTSTPVLNEVLTPAQINSAFSSITYDKGSSLLRMLESTVGPDNFRQGLINFLKANEFQAAVGAEFYNSLRLPSEMSGVTPQEYMENWLLQINYPEVAVLMELENSVTRIKFRQSRFLLSPEGIDGADQVSPFNYKWMIYLQCKAGGSIVNGVAEHTEGEIEEFNYFLRDSEGSISLKRRYTWVKCNKDFRGYYVTDYSDANFQALENVLINRPDVFSIGDRSNLIHVAYSLAYLGSKSYSTPAFLTNYLEAWERDYVPWRTFTWHMSKIATILEHRPGFANLKEFGVDISRSLINKMNLWDDEGNHLERLLKISMIDFLCRMQDEYCLRNATLQYEKIDTQYFVNPTEVINSVSPNLRGLVLKYHLQNTYDYLDWFDVFDIYILSVDPQERAQVLSAIANTRLMWIVDIELVELLEDKSRIRAQDFFSLLNEIGRNPSGRHLAWYFVRHYWYDIIAKFGVSSRTLANSVKSICSSFDSIFLYEEMINFFDTTYPGGGALQRLQARDIVLHNIFWINDREPDINQNLFIPFRK